VLNELGDRGAELAALAGCLTFAPAALVLTAALAAGSLLTATVRVARLARLGRLGRLGHDAAGAVRPAGARCAAWAIRNAPFVTVGEIAGWREFCCDLGVQRTSGVLGRYNQPCTAAND
jgi:hypothetical protein